MSDNQFVQRYGGIYEHSPWIAERAEEILGDSAADHEALAVVMADIVDNAAVDRQLALIRAHPDLAGKAQVAGELTAESTEEQSRAGLDQCSAEEFERLQALNTAYKEKFEFPFIMAVRESGRAEILAAFEKRMLNDRDTEFEMALEQIHTIARLRLAALLDES